MFNLLLQFKMPDVLQWKRRAEVRSAVRWWHISSMIAEPKAPSFILLVVANRDQELWFLQAGMYRASLRRLTAGTATPSITNVHRERVH